MHGESFLCMHEACWMQDSTGEVILGDGGCFVIWGGEAGRERHREGRGCTCSQHLCVVQIASELQAGSIRAYKGIPV